MVIAQHQPFFRRKNYASGTEELSVIDTKSQEQLCLLRPKTFYRRPLLPVAKGTKMKEAVQTLLPSCKNW
jgi:hypothetical protein